MHLLLYSFQNLTANRRGKKNTRCYGNVLSGVLLLACILMAGGCAKNVVPLVYSTPGESTMPMGNATVACLIPFTDARADAAVGSRKDGSMFSPASNISHWVEQSLAVELDNAGLLVTRAANEEDPKAKNSRYVVSGTVDEIWLTEESTTRYHSRMRVTLIVSSGGKEVLKKTFSASLKRTVLPMASVPGEMLADTLRDITVPMAHAVKELISR